MVFRVGGKDKKPSQHGVSSHRFVRHGAHGANLDSVLVTVNGVGGYLVRKTYNSAQQVRSTSTKNWVIFCTTGRLHNTATC